MARFNTPSHTNRRGSGTTSVRDTGIGHEGSFAVRHDAKTELFTLASTTFVENNFYESADAVSSRLSKLAAEVAVADTAWFTDFVGWLRSGGNMRTASVLVAVSGAHALQKAGIPGGRKVIANAIRRADEPGEVVAAWRALYGRTLPMSVRKGINDGIAATWNEYSVAKYGSESAAFSLRDVMNLTHPKLANAALGGFIMADAYGREVDLSELPMLRARREFLDMTPAAQRRFVTSGKAASAGLTWEVVSSVLGKPDAELWEALLPTMGYMAKLRSLRRLLEAGVSDATIRRLADELSNPEAVAKSRQLPLRFLSADREVGNRELGAALERAVQLSVSNVTPLPGRTLVLVDRSASMRQPLSQRSSLTREDAACLFGAVIALRSAKATLVDFGATSEEVPLSSIERSVLSMAARGNRVGHATYTATATAKHYKGHDRVIILTDDQSKDGDPGAVVPGNVPVYLWNLNSYTFNSMVPGPNRYVFSGLTDASFDAIRLIEAGRDQSWPWEAR